MRMYVRWQLTLSVLKSGKQLVFNSVLNFRRVTYFWLCLLETQVVSFTAEYYLLVTWDRRHMGHWADSVSKSQCLWLCRLYPLGNPASWWTGRLLVEKRTANICKPLEIFVFSSLQGFFVFWFFWGFRVFANLLWIMGELAGGGSVAVTVGVSEKLQVTSNT